MIMADTVLSGKVSNELEEELRQSGLMGPFLDVTSPRFIKFLLQPKLIMRSDWLFDPQHEVSEREVRAYVLRAPHDFEKEGVLQQLIIDRNQRKASLVTQGLSKRQTIEVDLRSFEVLANSSSERAAQ
ncbi:MAG: hypothetical protein KF760_26310 [Candidatus Eremiobacteraeota bacterium]|nr:hypothetical protein [Candidatus Eremiobacteraeota bacterium]